MTGPRLQRDQLERLARDAGFPDLAPRLPALAEPALRLVERPGATPGRSRLGGRPDLPPDVAWPVGADGVPMTCFGQLALPDDDALPLSGVVLALFAPWDADTGEAFGPARAVVLDPLSPDAGAGPREPPPGTAELPAVAVALRPELTLPGAGAEVLAEFGLGPDGFRRWGRYAALLEELDRLQGVGAPEHRLFGHPVVLQHDVLAAVARSEPGGEDWRLLAQVDGESAQLGASFGDGGLLWLCVPRRDLAAGRTERVVAWSASS